MADTDDVIVYSGHGRGQVFPQGGKLKGGLQTLCAAFEKTMSNIVEQLEIKKKNKNNVIMYLKKTMVF